MRNKIQTRSLICITVLVITVLAIAGCSEIPYTGAMLTADDVDRYLTAKDGETYCLVNGPDSACLTLTPTVEPQHANAPIIHIYPQKIVYVFYREGVPVLTAEKVMDTTEIVEKLTEPDPEPQPPEDIETQPSEETPPEDTQPPVVPPHDPDYLQRLPILGEQESEPPAEPPSEDPQPEPEPEPEPPIINTQPLPEAAEPPTVDPPPPPPRTNTGDEWLIRIYYDVGAEICPGSDTITKGCAEAYILDRYTLEQSGFEITINDDEITSDNIEGEVGVVSNEPPYRPGFQFVYRTTAASLDIIVKGPHGEVHQLKISGF